MEIRFHPRLHAARMHSGVVSLHAAVGGVMGLELRSMEPRRPAGAWPNACVRGMERRGLALTESLRGQGGCNSGIPKLELARQGLSRARGRCRVLTCHSLREGS